MNFYIPKKESNTGENLTEDRWESKVAIEETASQTKQLVAFYDLFSKLSERTREIDNSLIIAKKEVSDLRKNTESKINYVLVIAGIIIVGFFLAAVPIFLDSLWGNETRYEKFIDKTEEMKQNFSSKEEISKINRELKNLKDCLNSGGYYRCFK